MDERVLPKVYEPFPAGERPEDWPIEYVGLAAHNAIVERLTAERDAAEKKLDDWYRTEAKWNSRVMQLLRDLAVSKDGHFEFEAYVILQGHREIERPADSAKDEHG